MWWDGKANEERKHLINHEKSQIRRTRINFGFHQAGDKSLPKQPFNPQTKRESGHWDCKSGEVLMAWG